MRRLSLAEANALRRTAGATVALFLTDRCPVGCGHCSVSSRVDSPRISDWALFAEIVAGVSALPSVRVVAITGGEPFVERRGLTYAVRRLAAAGKLVVLFTSGYWARATIPAWIHGVLALTSTVFVSTDSFHTAGLASTKRPEPAAPRPELTERPEPAAPRPAASVAVAAETVIAAGCGLVLQVLDEPGAVDAARALCPTADVSVIPALPVGRGRDLFAPTPPRPAADFGRCTLLNSPTVRYDGWVTACCNEAVITGAGPAALRRQVTTAEGVGSALAAFGADPVLRLMGSHGPVALTTVADSPFRTICQSCWAAHDRAAADPKALAAVTVLSSQSPASGQSHVGGQS